MFIGIEYDIVGGEGAVGLQGSGIDDELLVVSVPVSSRPAYK